MVYFTSLTNEDGLYRLRYVFNVEQDAAYETSASRPWALSALAPRRTMLTEQ
jgi:hypothetical protein